MVKKTVPHVVDPTPRGGSPLDDPAEMARAVAATRAAVRAELAPVLAARRAEREAAERAGVRPRAGQHKPKTPLALRMAGMASGSASFTVTTVRAPASAPAPGMPPRAPAEPPRRPTHQAIAPEASAEPPVPPGRPGAAPPGRSVGRGRTAPVKRNANDFRQTDIALLDEMRAMVERSEMSATGAAWRLIEADRVPGPGVPQSRVTRLVRQYHERWPGSRRRRGHKG